MNADPKGLRELADAHGKAGRFETEIALEKFAQLVERLRAGATADMFSVYTNVDLSDDVEGLGWQDVQNIINAAFSAVLRDAELLRGELRRIALNIGNLRMELDNTYMPRFSRELKQIEDAARKAGGQHD